MRVSAPLPGPATMTMCASDRATPSCSPTPSDQKIARSRLASVKSIPPSADTRVKRTSGACWLRSEERREGKSVSVRVDLGGRRYIKKNTTYTHCNTTSYLTIQRPIVSPTLQHQSNTY